MSNVFEEDIEKKVKDLEKIVVKLYDIIKMHGWEISFPNLQELIESIRDDHNRD